MCLLGCPFTLELRSPQLLWSGTIVHAEAPSHACIHSNVDSLIDTREMRGMGQYRQRTGQTSGLRGKRLTVQA